MILILTAILAVSEAGAEPAGNAVSLPGARGGQSFPEHIGSELSQRMFIRIFWQDAVPRSHKFGLIAVNGYKSFLPIANPKGTD
jgi:hypothetical protein